MSEAKAARVSTLEKELEERLGALEDASAQAQALSSENAALRDELARAQERMHMLEQDHTSTQAGPSIHHFMFMIWPACAVSSACMPAILLSVTIARLIGFSETSLCGSWAAGWAWIRRLCQEGSWHKNIYGQASLPELDLQLQRARHKRHGH